MTASRLSMHLRGLLLVTITSLSLIACSGGGGGGGGGGDETPSPQEPESSKVSLVGIVSKGPVSSANLSFYALDSNGRKGLLLATAATVASGAYSASIEGYQGPVLIEANAGSYIDEATTNTTDNATLRAGVEIGTEDQVLASITAITEVAVRSSQVVSGGETSFPPSTLQTFNQQLSSAFGFDIINTQPADVLDPASASANDGQKNYGLALAAFSQSATSSSLDTQLTAVADDLVADSTLDATGPALISALNEFIQAPQNQSGVSSSGDTELDDAIDNAATTPISPSSSFREVSLYQWWNETSPGETLHEAEQGIATLNPAGSISVTAITGAWIRQPDMTVSAFGSTDPGDTSGGQYTDTGSWTQTGNVISVTFPDSSGDLQASADGNNLLHASIAPDGDYSFFFASRIRDSGYSKADIAGRSYSGIQIEKRFRDGVGGDTLDGITYPAAEFLSFPMELSFNTGDTCSLRFNAERLRQFNNGSSFTNSLASYTTDSTFISQTSSCTYSVTDSGRVLLDTMLDGSPTSFNFGLNHSGSIILQGNAIDDTERKRARIRLFFRDPLVDYAAVDIRGYTYYFAQDTNYSDTNVEEIWSDTGTLQLNADGSCNLSSTNTMVSRSFSGSYSSLTVDPPTPETITACSWGHNGSAGIDPQTGSFTVTITSSEGTDTGTIQTSGNGQVIYFTEIGTDGGLLAGALVGIRIQ